MRLDLFLLAPFLIYLAAMLVRKELRYQRDIKPHIGFDGQGITGQRFESTDDSGYDGVLSFTVGGVSIGADGRTDGE